MTEIVVVPEDHVADIFIERPHGEIYTLQGDVKVILVTPEGTENSVYSTTTVRRELSTTSPEVQAAVDLLVTTIMDWYVEDQAFAALEEKI